MSTLVALLTVFLLYAVAHASMFVVLQSYQVKHTVTLGVAIAFGILSAIFLVLTGSVLN